MTYQFKCSNCGVFDEHFSMVDAPPVGSTIPCRCGSVATRIFSAVHTDMVENVRYSMALKVHPDEVRDGTANRMHPGAEFTPDGTMVIHSRKEKLKRMKERSAATGQQWVEYE